MTSKIDVVALSVFIFFFAIVTVMGFVAARWKKPDTLAHIDEWGLGGRQFGTWITWFLVGGDFYTAYTVIAVPAVVYTVGAYGFFALPYTIIVYPFVFAVMPLLWKVAKDNNYVTAGDVVYGRYGSRSLEAAIAATGVIATMPYIALQLVGMAAVIKALGLTGEIPLVVAFLILALYTYSSGLRAPALIAFVKDIMIYIAVLAAVIYVPSKLGGYGAIFAAASAALDGKVAASSGKLAAGLILKPTQMLPYASSLWARPWRPSCIRIRLPASSPAIALRPSARTRCCCQPTRSCSDCLPYSATWASPPISRSLTRTISCRRSSRPCSPPGLPASPSLP